MINKSELIKKIADKIPFLNQKVIETSVNSIIDLIADGLSNGKRVEIRGFGSFSVRYRAPRQAHNPKTGEKVATAGKYVVHFKPGKELRKCVDDSKNITSLVK
jgi:integration host factor subunit beta